MAKQSRMSVGEARHVLGLPDQATLEEMKEAVRRCARAYHPDTCPDNDTARCEEKMKQVNEASEVIREFCRWYPLTLDNSHDHRPETEDERLMEEHRKRFYDNWFDV